MTDQPGELSIGQVAERTGLSVHALRFYEREGVFLSPIRRAAGSRRVYTEDDVDWLTLCTILRGAGMPLEDIRRYTELVRAGGGNEPERLALLRQHKKRVREQQQKLDRCLDLIRFKIGIYEDILAGGTAPAEGKASLPAAIVPNPRGISGPRTRLALSSGRRGLAGKQFDLSGRAMRHQTGLPGLPDLRRHEDGLGCPPIDAHPSKVPSSGFFATQRCHRGEAKRPGSEGTGCAALTISIGSLYVTGKRALMERAGMSILPGMGLPNTMSEAEYVALPEDLASWIEVVHGYVIGGNPPIPGGGGA
jgi:DNA-binding transcriptional MerR regulator